MAHQPMSEREAAARLLGALDAADEVSCAQAQLQLPALVEAEQAGEDVDRLPQFAALLRHLDACASCLALYEQLTADVAALLEDAAPLPMPATELALSAPAVSAGGAAVRFLRGLRRHFEITVSVPRWQPAATGETRRHTLFSGTLDDLAGKPEVEVQLRQQGASPALQVTIREQSPAARWRVQLAQGGGALSAVTDARGVAQLQGFDADALRRDARLDLLVSEEPAA